MNNSPLSGHRRGSSGELLFVLNIMLNTNYIRVRFVKKQLHTHWWIVQII